MRFPFKINRVCADLALHCRGIGELRLNSGGAGGGYALSSDES